MDRSHHTRYAVRVLREDGWEWVGSKAFSYSAGKYARKTDFAHARLFTRECDAESAAPPRGQVVPVTISLP